MSAFKRVVLIKPIYYHSHYKDLNLVAGLGYISEALSLAGICNTVIDMELGYGLKTLIARIHEFEADLIGLSMMSFGYKRTYEFIVGIKESFPQTPVVIGGPHVSTLREQVLNNCSNIDYGITLEGEETIVELCRGDLSLHEIKGLLYRDATGKTVYTGDRRFIQDLDSKGFPRYAQFELPKYPRPISIPVVTSRGCPYRCIYCPVHLAIGGQFRVRSATSVADEFEYWYGKGYRDFDIVDDNFTLHRDRVLEICDELEKRQLFGLRITCGNGLRADKVDRKLLERMKEVGFCYIAFGVEGGNNKVLAMLRKGQNIETIEQAIKDSCDLGYQVTLFFLLGSPGETKEDVEDSVRLALKYPVYDVRFYNLIPFPNTELFDWVNENHYFVRGDDYLNDASHWVNKPIFATPELSLQERKRLYKWANTITKWHTLKVKRRFHYADVAAKFQSLGFPSWASKCLASLYWTRTFQQGFVQTKLGSIVKGLVPR